MVIPDFCRRLQSAAKKFDTLIRASTLSGDNKKQLSKLMKLYQSQVAAYARARIANKNNVGRLNEIYAYMIPSVDTLAGFAGNQIKTTERNLRETVKLTRVSLVGGGGFLLIIMTITGVILLRSLTLPIRETAVAAGKLVSGESDVEVPALGNADEIGELARALAIFGATLEEVVQLRSEAHIARAAAEEAEAALQGQTDTTADEAEVPAPVVAEAVVTVKPIKAPALETPQVQLPQPQEPEYRPSVPSNALTGPISTISQQVAQASKNVTDAAYEAERTGALTQRLTAAVRRLTEVRELLSEVEEQADFLVFKPGSKFPREGDAPANLVVLTPESRSSSDQLGVGEEAVGKRFDIIRATNTQVTRAIKDISELIGDAKNTAHDIATTSSEQALKITSDLLKQSEYLRWMLNEQVSKLDRKPSGYEEDNGSSEFSHNQPPNS
jgi:methyl-accepting chemotaxis protein